LIDCATRDNNAPHAYNPEDTMLATLSLPSLPDSRPALVRTVRVRSADELREAIRLTRGVAVTLDASDLDRVLRLDASRDLVEVQAGTPWSALCAYLAERVPELERLLEGGAMPGTVGECVAANVAGPDGRPMVAHVEALALVTPDGQLRRASRFANKELFALAIGGQDLFGAPYSVTLRIDSLRRSARNCEPPAVLELPAAGAGAQCTLRLLVAPQQLDGLLAQVRERCAEWRIGICGIEVRRILPEDETLLRWARCESAQITLRLEVPVAIGGCVRSVQLRRELIDIALAAGGGFPIADNFDASREQTEACYPELKTLLAEKRRRDPEERLRSVWYHHYRSLLSRGVCQVRWSN
jgi:hypothetical protein